MQYFWVLHGISIEISYPSRGTKIVIKTSIGLEIK